MCHICHLFFFSNVQVRSVSTMWNITRLQLKKSVESEAVKLLGLNSKDAKSTKWRPFHVDSQKRNMQINMSFDPTDWLLHFFFVVKAQSGSHFLERLVFTGRFSEQWTHLTECSELLRITRLFSKLTGSTEVAAGAKTGNKKKTDPFSNGKSSNSSQHREAYLPFFFLQNRCWFKRCQWSLHRQKDGWINRWSVDLLSNLLFIPAKKKKKSCQASSHLHVCSSASEMGEFIHVGVKKERLVLKEKEGLVVRCMHGPQSDCRFYLRAVSAK